MKNLKLTPTYDTHKRLDIMEHRKLFNCNTYVLKNVLSERYR
jgi:hypothetical protein